MSNPKGSDERIVKLEDAPTQTVSVEAKQILPTHGSAKLSGAKVRVTFHEQEGDGGGDAIFAGIGESPFSIPRGIPVDIPVELLKVFDNAKIETLTTKVGGGHNKRHISRYNYTVHGPV